MRLEMVKLERCPFCGDEATVNHYDRAVICLGCNAMVKDPDHDGKISAVIKNWNMRNGKQKRSS